MFEYETAMKNLIKYVMKVFYEPQHVDLMNILLEKTIATEEECCKIMKLLNREFNKIITKLKDDKLIKSEQKIISKDEIKNSLNTVYYLNYAEIKDIVKYKILKMTETIEKNITVKDDYFYCNTCKLSYSILDAQAYMDNFIFKCPICKNELIENVINLTNNCIDNKEFIQMLEPLINILKDVEQYKIPHMEYFQIRELKNTKEINTTKDQSNFYKDNSMLDNSIACYDITNKIDFSNEHTSLYDNGEIIKNELESTVSNVMVSVNGISKPFSEITDEDKDKMTEDEYIIYYNVYTHQKK